MTSGDYHGAVPLGLEDTVDTVLLVWGGRELGPWILQVAAVDKGSWVQVQWQL